MGNALVVDVVARIAEVLRSEWDWDRLLSVTEVDLFPHGYAGLRPFPQAVESRTTPRTQVNRVASSVDSQG